MDDDEEDGVVGQRCVGRWGAVRARGERARMARRSPNIFADLGFTKVAR